MAFGLLYMLMALIGKTGSDIKYGLDRISARERAKEKGNDTYIDGRGITRTVNGNKAVSMYMNNQDEVLLLDKNGNTVKVYNKKNEESYSIVTAKQCFDNRGNYMFSDIPGRHKNLKIQGYRYVDTRTGEYMSVRWIPIDGFIKRHFFYINPYTLELIRETDGEVELRQRGNKFSPSKEQVDEFIKTFNKKQKERYEPVDLEWIGEDISMESINKTIWKQNHKEV